MAGWDNPDVDLLYDINGMAKDAPDWVDRGMGFVGEYGIVAALLLLGVWAWWGVRRSSPNRETAVSGMAALIWTPLAAAVALLVNIPVRGLVERPRPFLDHKGLEVLVEGKRDFSFVSDHATMAMALAIGLFIVNRRLGLAGIGLAVVEAFCRVYMGVHYPTDVIGGLALGTAVALLLAPLALWLLTPLARAVADSPRVGGLVWAADAPGGATADGGTGPEPARDGAAPGEPNGSGPRRTYGPDKDRGTDRGTDRDKDLAA